VLGCGDAAARLFIPGLRGASGSALVAIASRDPNRARECADRFGCEATGYDELLGRDDVDVVYLGLPVALHAAWATKALRAGKHVYCEKTLAPSLQDTELILAAAEEAGRRVAEGLMYRFHPLLETVMDLIRAGDIGSPRSFVGSFGFTLPPDDRLRRDPDMAMGSLNEVGCYAVSAARLVFGQLPERVAGHLAGPVGAEESGSAWLHFGGDGAAHCDFGFERSYRSGYAIWGTGGSLSVERAFTTPPDLEPVIELRKDGEDDRQVGVPAANHFTRMIDAFGEAISTGGAHEQFEGDARDQALALEAIRRAAAEGSIVRPAELVTEIRA
jgi:predicted dehydrogenase